MTLTLYTNLKIFGSIKACVHMHAFRIVTVARRNANVRNATSSTPFRFNNLVSSAFGLRVFVHINLY